LPLHGGLASICDISLIHDIFLVPYFPSSIWQGAMMKYAKNMAAWAACEGIKEVIVLSGLDSGKRQRHDMDLYVVLHSVFALLPA
jgi:predicted ATP-grasp superfamily ATP-dependent carboligase